MFFPTEESCPLPLILHGAFDLEQNRKRVRPAGNRADIVLSLARCVKSVLASVQDDGTFLDLLTAREGMTGLDGEIWEAIKTEVRDMPLPQSGIRVCDLRLCPETSAKDFPWYFNRLPNWQKFKEVLMQHRPGALAGLQLLASGVDTEKREKVVCAFNPSARFSVEELRKLSLFPIEGGGGPMAASDCHLFFLPKDGQLRPAPEGIQVGFIRQGFAAGCEQYADVKRLLQALGLQEFTPPGITKALAAQQLDTATPEALWDYLLCAIAPLLKDSDAVMDWKSNDRESLAERVKVPCRDGEWKAAKEVYAGREWTENDFLERAYGSHQDRWFLAAPPVDGATRKSFELLARWLGVGWSPKVLRVVNEGSESGTQRGPQWQGGVFPVPTPPARWRVHCTTLNKDHENDARSARLRQDWKLDGDEWVLTVSGAFASVAREWGSYKGYLQAVIYRSSNMRCDYDNERLWDPPSYLSHLFRHVSWIPVDGSEKPAAAHDIFAKDSEVHQALAGWVFATVGEVPDDVQKGIGIRSSWNAVTKDDWNRWLSAAVDSEVEKHEECRASVKRLYSETLRRSSSVYSGKIWCVQKRRDNTEQWHLESTRQNVFFVDRPDLARLRLEGIRTLPVELGWSGNKQKASEVFGIQPLSERLRGKPEFRDGETQAHLADEIRNRLQDRSDCLAAYLRVKGKDPASAGEKWRELVFRVGPNLRVSFLLGDRPLETQSCPTFFQPKSAQEPPALWLDAGENFADCGQPRDILWEEVGSALCYTAGLALEDGAVFAALLGCDQDSLKRKLLNLGVTEADVISALPRTPIPTPTAPPAATPTPPPLTPTGTPTVTTPTSSPTTVPGGFTQPGGGHPPSTGGGGRGGGHGGGGGGGENRAHRELKDKLWQHPELIEPGMQQFQYEPDLASHYRPDLVLKDAHERLVAVEVETEFPGESDYGVWQAVAYKHVAAAEFQQTCGQVRGILVAPQIPESLKQKCRELGVEAVEVGSC